jgi:hypothetical protein
MRALIWSEIELASGGQQEYATVGFPGAAPDQDFATDQDYSEWLLQQRDYNQDQANQAYRDGDYGAQACYLHNVDWFRAEYDHEYLDGAPNNEEWPTNCQPTADNSAPGDGHNC